MRPNEVRSKKALCGLLWKARDRSPAPLIPASQALSLRAMSAMRRDSASMHMSAATRPQKITFAEMRAAGVRGVARLLRRPFITATRLRSVAR
jgi:hypothetical protein